MVAAAAPATSWDHSGTVCVRAPETAEDADDSAEENDDVPEAAEPDAPVAPPAPLPPPAGLGAEPPAVGGPGGVPGPEPFGPAVPLPAAAPGRVVTASRISCSRSALVNAARGCAMADRRLTRPPSFAKSPPAADPPPSRSCANCSAFFAD